MIVHKEQFPTQCAVVYRAFKAAKFGFHIQLEIFLNDIKKLDKIAKCPGCQGRVVFVEQIALPGSIVYQLFDTALFKTLEKFQNMAKMLTKRAAIEFW